MKSPAHPELGVAEGDSSPGCHSPEPMRSPLHHQPLSSVSAHGRNLWVGSTHPWRVPGGYHWAGWIGGVLGTGAKNLQGSQTRLCLDTRYGQAGSDSSVDINTQFQADTHLHTLTLPRGRVVMHWLFVTHHITPLRGWAVLGTHSPPLPFMLTHSFTCSHPAQVCGCGGSGKGGLRLSQMRLAMLDVVS